MSYNCDYKWNSGLTSLNWNFQILQSVKGSWVTGEVRDCSSPLTGSRGLLHRAEVRVNGQRSRHHADCSAASKNTLPLWPLLDLCRVTHFPLNTQHRSGIRMWKPHSCADWWWWTWQLDERWSVCHEELSSVILCLFRSSVQRAFTFFFHCTCRRRGRGSLGLSNDSVCVDR